MIKLFFHAGAVMYGYTSDMTDFDCSVEFIPTPEMNWRDAQYLRGLAPLPDVIVSNTPPSSSLTRAHPCVPERPSHAQSAPPTSHHLNLNRPVQGGSSSPKHVFDGRQCEETIKTGVRHIQDVRRRLQSDVLLHTHPHHYLPQLSWRQFPRRHHPFQHQEDGDSGQGDEAEEEDQRGTVGRDLRKVADQFQATSAKVAAKRSVAPMSVAVPVAFAKCLSAFVLGLVWWRLFNKLR
ncbi:uncharacterized protein [Panulirus ornatus]|uniref:uncharacterized protein n=1 Tax=Panulirus ornatus TaxID=150431 RepID=UPI003A897179